MQWSSEGSVILENIAVVTVLIMLLARLMARSHGYLYLNEGNSQDGNKLGFFLTV